MTAVHDSEAIAAAVEGSGGPGRLGITVCRWAPLQGRGFGGRSAPLKAELFKFLVNSARQRACLNCQ